MIRTGPSQQQVQQGYPPSAFQPHAQQQPHPMHNGPAAQQQQQQGGPGSTTDGGQGSGSGGVGAGQEMNLAGVLHYLQSEWRRWERDRNEWEIERAEMRARVALLEGQRRSAENLKVDLLRRVKMLEFALRQERTKTVGTSGRASGINPSKLALLKQEDDDKASSRDEKESTSEGSEEGSGDRKPNGTHHPAPSAMTKSLTTTSRQGSADGSTGVWKTIGGVPRDPKSRARSREYLKQCLQEITYLTSPGALNPLPPRPPINLEGGEPIADRPVKSLSEQVSAPIPHEARASEDKGIPNGVSENPTVPPPQASSSSAPAPQNRDTQGSASQAMAMENTARPPESPLTTTVGLPDIDGPAAEERPRAGEGESSGSVGGQESGGQILTAIYRPDSKAAWREELRAANDKAEKAQEERLRLQAQQSGSAASDEEQLANLTLQVPDDEETKAGVEVNDVTDKTWTCRRTLKSHLDVVRAVAFAGIGSTGGPGGPGTGGGKTVTLASGGDDCAVKVWSLDVASVLGNKPNTMEIEPIMTYRGHTSPITSLQVSTALSTIFSASLDSTIRLWRLPSPSQDPYAPHDPSFTLQTLEGHTEAVWDIRLLPPLGPHQSGGRLVSASADGTVKLWEVAADEGAKWELKRSWALEGNPTCLASYNLDYGRVLVGLGDGRVKVLDVVGEDGEVGCYGELNPDAQVNAILSHPVLPAIITASEDGHLRFFDAKSSSPQPTHTLLAHPSPLTSITPSPTSPTDILTASTDCTARLWDLARRTSLQDLTGHRQRADEGVTCVVGSAGGLPLVATAGGDGVVRIWGM